MSRYRLYPTPEQATKMAEHCAHARFVWNLGLEQRLMWRRGRRSSPGYLEQSRQLTEARLSSQWLADGSQTVQQQALRDLERAWQTFFTGLRRRPSWRKQGRNDGFQIVGRHAQHLQILNRRWSSVLIPKVGWVKFRRSRPVPEAKSYRVTLDRSGRWHIAFAAIPESIEGPGDGSTVGIDRGVMITLALSDGMRYQAPVDRSVRRLRRRLDRCQKGSNRRVEAKHRLARVHARNADRRKDWVEKSSTTIARAYDLIRIEDLRVQRMTGSARGTIEKPGRNVARKAGLNRAILAQGWGTFARRLEDKASGRVEKVNPAFTSQRCSSCGHVAAESRKNQALFVCVACKFTLNADLNAARNIAAGHAVTGRGGSQLEPVKRQPQRVTAGTST